jgi:hypothetical protein
MAEVGSTSFSEDWDRLTPAPTTPPPNSRQLPDDFEDCTPGGTRTARSLSDLMRLHAEHGKENLQLNPQEERRLEEELAKWVSGLVYTRMPFPWIATRHPLFALAVAIVDFGGSFSLC